jgi:hypothetical protein
MDKTVPLTERDAGKNNRVHTADAITAIADLHNALGAAGWPRDDVELATVQALIRHRLNRLADNLGRHDNRDLDICESLLIQMIQDEVAILRRLWTGKPAARMPVPATAPSPHLKLVSSRIARERL